MIVSLIKSYVKVEVLDFAFLVEVYIYIELPCGDVLGIVNTAFPAVTM